MENYLALYSINTLLSYKIAETFYENVHYAWCAPKFNAESINPPTANPYEIYRSLKKEVESKDKHSSKIEQNKSGIIKGALLKKKKNIITEEQEKQIQFIVNHAEIDLFEPLVYVIPYSGVLSSLKPAEINMKAHFFSKEYIIEELPRIDFDIIKF